MARFLDKLRERLRNGRIDTEVKTPPAAIAPGGRLAAPPEQRRTHRVYVGLDFGTCSCKAVVQIDPEDQMRRHFLAIAHPSAIDGASPLLCPSTVDVRGGQLFFGYQAEVGASSQTVRSFKMCLPCLWHDSRTNGPCPRCSPQKPGHFILDGRWWSAEEVSILFLAQVIRGIKDSVLKHVAGDPVQFFINSAAPLDQMPQDSELGRSFQRVLYYADRLSHRACNPWPLTDAAAALNEFRQQAMPDLNECPTTVFPETHAAMTSVLAPLQAHRNFGTVDIGAGTTDVAFFYYHRTNGEPEACYYRAKSEFVGMDQLDATVRQSVPAGTNLRAWREHLSPGDLQQFTGSFAEPIEAMFRHFRTRLGESYVQNPGLEYWDDLTVFLTGGGSQFGQVRQRFRRSFPFIVGEHQVAVEIPDLPDTVLLLIPDGNALPLDGQYRDRPLLLLAYGLAHGAASIANWIKDYSFYHEHQAGDGGLVVEVPYDEM